MLMAPIPFTLILILILFFVLRSYIMGPRKYPSGHEKRKKKQKVEALTQSQTGAIHKFFIPTKEVESSAENVVNVEDENLLNEEEDHDNLNESDDGNSTQNKDLNIEVEPQNIDDPINLLLSKYIK